MVCTKCVLTMLEGVSQLFKNFIDASITVGKIDKLESGSRTELRRVCGENDPEPTQADRIEFDLTNRIFSSDMPDLQKILLRDLVDKIGGVADRSESVGDRIRIMVAKRSV